MSRRKTPGSLSRAPGNGEGVDEDFVRSLYNRSAPAAPETPEAPQSSPSPLKRLVGDVGAGVVRAGSGAVEGLGYLTGSDSLKESGKNMENTAQGVEQWAGINEQNKGMFDKVVQGITTTGLFFIPFAGWGGRLVKGAGTIAKAIDVAGVAAPAVVMAGSTAQGTYDAAIAQGMSPEDADSAAKKRFVADIVLQAGIGKIAGGVGSGLSIPKRLAIGGGSGAALGAAGSVATDLSLGNQVDYGRAAQSGIETALVGGGLTAGHVLADRLMPQPDATGFDQLKKVTDNLRGSAPSDISLGATPDQLAASGRPVLPTDSLTPDQRAVPVSHFGPDGLPIRPDVTIGKTESGQPTLMRDVTKELSRLMDAGGISWKDIETSAGKPLDINNVIGRSLALKELRKVLPKEITDPVTAVDENVQPSSGKTIDVRPEGVADSRALVKVDKQPAARADILEPTSGDVPAERALTLKGVPQDRAIEVAAKTLKMPAADLEARLKYDNPYSPEPAAKTSLPPDGAVSSPQPRLATGESLSQFVAKNGGIRPTKGLEGEYATLHPKETGKNIIGLRNRKGLTFDEMRAKAVEAGYMSPEDMSHTNGHASTSSVSDFIDLLHRDIRDGSVRKIDDTAHVEKKLAAHEQKAMDIYRDQLHQKELADRQAEKDKEHAALTAGLKTGDTFTKDGIKHTVTRRDIPREGWVETVKDQHYDGNRMVKPALDWHAPGELPDHGSIRIARPDHGFADNTEKYAQGKGKKKSKQGKDRPAVEEAPKAEEAPKKEPSPHITLPEKTPEPAPAKPKMAELNGHKIYMHSDERTLPERMQGKNAQGVLDKNGDIHLVEKQLNFDDEKAANYAPKILAGELWGHKGLSALTKGERDTILTMLDKYHGDRINASEQVRIQSENGTISTAHEKAEEYFAHELATSEKFQHSGVAQVFFAGMRRMVRVAAKSLGLPEPKLSNSELSRMVVKARDAVMKGASSKGHVDSLKFHAAYHGSPHDFDRFTTQKIGTGEGAQVYGWGMYFAGSKKVAEWYRDKLSANSSAKSRRLIDMFRQARVPSIFDSVSSIPKADMKSVSDAVFEFYRVMKNNGNDVADASSQLRAEARRMASYNKVESKSDYHEPIDQHYIDGFVATANAISELRQRGVDISNIGGGKLYTVDLKPSEKDYLDWDRPNGQIVDLLPHDLVDALESAAMDRRGTKEGYLDSLYHDSKGSDLYHELIWYDGLPRVDEQGLRVYRENDRGERAPDNTPLLESEYGIKGNSPEERASKFLLSLGVPGIKFLDGSSRSKGEGHHNYVIFDDSHVKITDKYAQGKTPDEKKIGLDQNRERPAPEKDTGEAVPTVAKEVAGSSGRFAGLLSRNFKTLDEKAGGLKYAQGDRFANDREIQREKDFGATARASEGEPYEKPTGAREYVKQLKRGFVDEYAALKGIAKGSPEAKQFQDALNGFNYRSSPTIQYMKDVHDTVMRGIESTGVSLADFSKYLFHTRIAEGERVASKKVAGQWVTEDIKNPYAYTRDMSKAELRIFKDKIGADNFDKLKEVAGKWNEIRQKDIISKLEASGMFNEALMNKLKTSDHYVNFDVIRDTVDEVAGKGAGAVIMRQLGTTMNIKDPFAATLLKDAALINAVEGNTLRKRAAYLMGSHLDDGLFIKARVKFNGKSAFPEEPAATSKYGLVSYMENGKVMGFYAPKEMAESLKYDPGHANVFLDSMASVTDMFAQFFTGKRPGFWITNLQRDLMNTIKHNPGMNLVNFIPEMTKAFPEAWRGAFGKSEVVEKMMRDGMLISEPLGYGVKEGQNLLEHVMTKYGIIEDEIKNPVLRGIVKAWDLLGSLGEVSERVTKIAGKNWLEKNTSLSPVEIKDRVIHQVGSPNFLAKGAHNRLVKPFLLFANPMVQGWRSDIRAIQENPKDFAYKTVKYGIVPKLAMVAMASGIMGDDWKRWFGKVSEYDKTNYFILPFGEDSNGNAIYARIAPNEFDRALLGVMWKTYSRKDFQEVADYMSGQVPSLAPQWSMLFNVAQYATGHNPYDFFKGKNVVPERTFAAGGADSHAYFLKWLSNQTGVIPTIYKFDFSDPELVKGEIQKTLGLPVLNDTIGRVLKSSNQGEAEQYADIVKLSKQKDAQQSIASEKAIREAIASSTATGKLSQPEVRTLYMQEKKAGQYDGSFGQFALKVRRIESRGSDSAVVQAISRAGSNELKAQLLKKYKQAVDGPTYQATINELKGEGILTRKAIMEADK